MIKYTVSAIEAKKGKHILAIELHKVSSALTDFFILCQASNAKQTKAISEAIEETVLKECQQKPQNIVGKKESNWIIMDYFDVMVHIMTEEYRQHYKLEDLWNDVPQINLPITKKKVTKNK